MGLPTVFSSGQRDVPFIRQSEFLRKDTEASLREIRRRIIRARLPNISRWVREANCIGTALYISGEADREEYVDPTDAHRKRLSLLRKLERPVEGCIVAWQGNWHSDPLGRVLTEDTYTNHTGIVVSLSPLLVTHRKGIGTGLTRQQPLEEISKHEEMKDYGTFFYLPRMLASQYPESFWRKG